MDLSLNRRKIHNCFACFQNSYNTPENIVFECVCAGVLSGCNSDEISACTRDNIHRGPPPTDSVQFDRYCQSVGFSLAIFLLLTFFVFVFWFVCMLTNVICFTEKSNERIVSFCGYIVLDLVNLI